MNDETITSEIDGADRSFLAIVAHELRTPLTSVLGLLALLEDGSVRVTDPEARELASMGKGEAERMLLIVENLLLATRLSNGKLDPSVEDVELPLLLREVLGGLPEVARRSFVPIDRSAVVRADRHLVSLIVTNLLQNVARYAPGGEVEIRFGLRDGHLEMSVADDGPGVPPESVEAVFSAPQSEKGLGMGLSVSRQLARAMGGELVVGSEPIRSGATFVLRLPAAPPRPATVQSLESGHSVRADEAALTPSARLLVDMTEVLADRSLDRLVAGLHNMFSDLLGASAGYLVVRRRDGSLQRAGSFGSVLSEEITETPLVQEVLNSGTHIHVVELPECDAAWAKLLGARSALFLPVSGEEATLGVLAVGWDHPVQPSPRLLAIATALARLAAFGADRAALAADVAFERQLRSSVLEAFPIAVSVFMGDPPQLVDANQAERQMLGIAFDHQRPSHIALSQQTFDVRFLDGTPLSLDNAPVTETIRTGQSTGPFFLRVRRTDGSEIISRTYCAPFFNAKGLVAGAVVSSEQIDPWEVGARVAASSTWIGSGVD